MALIRPSTFFRHVSTPTTAIGDFITVFRQAGKNRWRIAVAAAAVTTGIFSVMFQEEVRGNPRPPNVTYITVWDPHRTMAQIVASNIENQKRKDRLAAEEAEREALRRDMYKTLGRMSGMDVDAIEKKAAAERAAEEAAQKAAIQKATVQKATGPTTPASPPAGE